jgi:DsbC/DsbD-like thiol-disulfide interchange protein
MKTQKALPVLFFIAVFCLAGAAPSWAQLEVPKVVSGRAVLSKSAVHPGEAVKIAVVLKIEKGWHINSDNPGDEFMFPSSIAFEEATEFSIQAVVFPKPKEAKFEYSDFELRVYEDEAVIGALIQIAGDLKPGSFKLSGAFKYQACDNKSCIMPQDLPFEIPVEVVAAGVETKDVEPELFAKIEFKDKG